MSSNQVTLLSLVFAVAGSLLLLFPSPGNYLLSAGLIMTFFLLDHVDGEVARYQKSVGRPGSGAAGNYFDRLVHYYQGPSFYFCLGTGMTTLDGNLLWVVAGMIAAIGSTGAPRFNAVFVVLPLVLKEPRDEALREVAGNVSDFNMLYWKQSSDAERFILFPRRVSDLKIMAKQYFTFPGNLFAFAGVALLDSLVLVTKGYPATRTFLLAFSLVLFLNTVYSTAQYLRVLSRLK